MDFVWSVVQFAIAWFAGSILSICAMQILISIFCAFPLIRALKPYAHCFKLSGCRKLFLGTIIINTIILGVVSWVALSFAPQIMKIGFFLSLGFTLLSGAGKYGPNEKNRIDFVHTLAKFALPGQEQEALAVIMDLTERG